MYYKRSPKVTGRNQFCSTLVQYNFSLREAQTNLIIFVKKAHWYVTKNTDNNKA